MTGITAGLGVATALGLAAGGFAYGAMAPASRMFGETLIAPRRPGELALTFDDGPNPVWTPRLLEVLASRGVKTTFFLVGSHAQAEPALVRRIAAGGHLIGNHSWSHPNLALASSRHIEEELRKTSELLEQLSGAPVKYFRPPFGGRRPAVLRIARSMGMIPVLWNALTTDWKTPSPDLIAYRLSEAIDRAQQGGTASNIVLHDGGHKDRAAFRSPSVNAATQLINRYKETHNFVTLDAWPATQS